MTQITTIHTWQTPKQRGRNKKKDKMRPCPCCNGTGKRRDRKTFLERDCVGCLGSGEVKINNDHGASFGMGY